MFFPNESSFSKDDLGLIAEGTRKYLSGLFTGEIVNTKGKFAFSERVFEIIKRTGQVIGLIVDNADKIRLPETKKERLALSKVLVDSLISFKGQLEIVCPVCPDYGTGNNFYRTMGDNLSPEAKAGIQSSKILLKGLSKLGFYPEIKIVVADTEDDCPEIIVNCAEGKIDFYKDQSRSSVKEIADSLKDYKEIDTQTFTDLYGNKFRANQYLFEKVIRDLMFEDLSFREIVNKLGSERTERHSQILGRREVNHELTIRYMAQYAGLGHIVREKYPLLLMNYQTPNRKFYNAAVNINKKLILDEKDYRVVPVIGTIVNRNNP